MHPPTAKADRQSSTGPALSVDRLTKRFGDGAEFEDVTFVVGRGEVFGFLGPNPSGNAAREMSRRQHQRA